MEYFKNIFDSKVTSVGLCELGLKKQKDSKAHILNQGFSTQFNSESIFKTNFSKNVFLMN